MLEVIDLFLPWTAEEDLEMDWLDVDLEKVQFYCFNNILRITIIAKCVEWYSA